jgi:CRISPR type III-A-associated protein Csm2
MQNHSPKPSKPPRQSFRESEDFQRFRELLQSGFVKEGTEILKPELLEFTERLAKILRRSERREFATLDQFRRLFQQVKGLQQVRDATALEVELRLLNAQITYADARQTISRNFSLVMQESLNSLLGCDQIPTQLPGMCTFFEALYAYYYYHTQRDMRRRRS